MTSSVLTTEQKAYMKHYQQANKVKIREHQRKYRQKLKLAKELGQVPTKKVQRILSPEAKSRMSSYNKDYYQVHKSRLQDKLEKRKEDFGEEEKVLDEELH